MLEFDKSYEELKVLISECNEFNYLNETLSETDTRVKIIDRILTDICGWPEQNITREIHSASGYGDYILEVFGKRFITVEAKRVGNGFLFPKDNRSKALKINGGILSNIDIKSAINQVRAYCDDHGIRFAIATNGDAWIIFRAITENSSWRDGSAKIFPSLEYIKDHFTEFWNILSFEMICKGSLDKEFGITLSPNRELHRVLSRLTNPDVPLLRNSLHSQLIPIITHFFEDIADPEHIETLENCYVYSKSLSTAADDINYVIKDKIPRFLKNIKTINLIESKKDAGDFGISLERAFNQSQGQLFLLLGGIGSGKTTFQKRYQLTVGKEALQNSIWFVLDFLKAPVDPSELDKYVWLTVLDQLRKRYNTPHLETRRNIKRVFRSEINALKETELYGLKEDSQQFESILTKHLTKWQENLSEYVPRLLSLAKPRQNLSVVLFFDNVDQLSPFYQSQIFLLAQNVTGKIGSISIVALREESYYAASVQKVFTAYINRKFHIASPPFRKMIGQRIKFALNVLEEKQQNISNSFLFNTNLFFQEDKNKITEFLKIVEKSIFEKNKDIARFIDHICFGNMRMALQMFGTFLVSGATDIDKMLRIYRREGNYYVPFHEFLRSIMLGDRMYYKEFDSTIFNLFECGSERNSSHFTSIRVLRILDKLKGLYDNEGRGYVEINKVINVFENKFNNTEDVIKNMNRMVAKQLIEVNTRSQENIGGSTHIRITSAGWYYLKYLASSFSYLDLVLQDTPINSVDIVTRLVNSVNTVNNLSDRDDEKVNRMEERFKRVRIFLEYLKSEEDHEFEKFSLSTNDRNDFPDIVSKIIDVYDNQENYIRRRIKENREAYAEDKLWSKFEEEDVNMLLNNLDVEDGEMEEN